MSVSWLPTAVNASFSDLENESGNEYNVRKGAGNGGTRPSLTPKKLFKTPLTKGSFNSPSTPMYYTCRAKRSPATPQSVTQRYYRELPKGVQKSRRKRTVAKPRNLDNTYLATPRYGSTALRTARFASTPTARKNFVVSKPEFWLDVSEGHLTAWFNSIMSPERTSITIPVGCYANSLVLSQRLRAMQTILKSERVQTSISRLNDEIASNKLRVDTNIRFRSTRQHQDSLVQLIITNYNPHWLFPALCVFFGTHFGSVIDSALEKAHISEDEYASERVIMQALEDLIREQLLNPDIVPLCGDLDITPRTLHMRNERADRNYNGTVLHRTFGLIMLLDAAKQETFDVIDTDPPLFRTTSKMTSSDDVVHAFSDSFIHEPTDVVRYLSCSGFSLSFMALRAERLYDWHTSNIISDMRDGVRLSKLVAILIKSNKLQESLTIEENAATQDVGIACMRNVHLSLRMLDRFLARNNRETNMQWMEWTENIVAGDRNQILKLLWQLADLHVRAHVLDKSALDKEIDELQKSLRRVKNEGKESLPWHTDTFSPTSDVQIFSNLESDASKMLLQWVALVCCHYGVCVSEFTEGFRDGAALCLLIHHYQPDAISREDIVKVTSLGGIEQSAIEKETSLVASNFDLFESAAVKLGGIPTISVNLRAAIYPILNREKEESFGKLMCLLSAYVFRRLVYLVKLDNTLEPIETILMKNLQAVNIATPSGTPMSPINSVTSTVAVSGQLDRNPTQLPGKIGFGSSVKNHYGTPYSFQIKKSAPTLWTSRIAKTPVLTVGKDAVNLMKGDCILRIQASMKSFLSRQQVIKMASANSLSAAIIQRNWRAYKFRRATLEALQKKKDAVAKRASLTSWFWESNSSTRSLVENVRRTFSKLERQVRFSRDIHRSMTAIEKTKTCIDIQRVIRSRSTFNAVSSVRAADSNSDIWGNTKSTTLSSRLEAVGNAVATASFFVPGLLAAFSAAKNHGYGIQNILESASNAFTLDMNKRFENNVTIEAQRNAALFTRTLQLAEETEEQSARIEHQRAFNTEYSRLENSWQEIASAPSFESRYTDNDFSNLDSAITVSFEQSRNADADCDNSESHARNAVNDSQFLLDRISTHEAALGIQRCIRSLCGTQAASDRKAQSEIESALESAGIAYEDFFKRLSSERENDEEADKSARDSIATKITENDKAVQDARSSAESELSLLDSEMNSTIELCDKLQTKADVQAHQERFSTDAQEYLEGDVNKSIKAEKIIEESARCSMQEAYRSIDNMRSLVSLCGFDKPSIDIQRSIKRYSEQKFVRSIAIIDRPDMPLSTKLNTVQKVVVEATKFAPELASAYLEAEAHGSLVANVLEKAGKEFDTEVKSRAEMASERESMRTTTTTRLRKNVEEHNQAENEALKLHSLDFSQIQYKASLVDEKWRNLQLEESEDLYAFDTERNVELYNVDRSIKSHLSSEKSARISESQALEEIVSMESVLEQDEHEDAIEHGEIVSCSLNEASLAFDEEMSRLSNLRLTLENRQSVLRGVLENRIRTSETEVHNEEAAYRGDLNLLASIEQSANEIRNSNEEGNDLPNCADYAMFEPNYEASSEQEFRSSEARTLNAMEETKHLFEEVKKDNAATQIQQAIRCWCAVELYSLFKISKEGELHGNDISKALDAADLAFESEMRRLSTQRNMEIVERLNLSTKLASEDELHRNEILLQRSEEANLNSLNEKSDRMWEAAQKGRFCSHELENSEEISSEIAIERERDYRRSEFSAQEEFALMRETIEKMEHNNCAAVNIQRSIRHKFMNKSRKHWDGDDSYENSLFVPSSRFNDRPTAFENSIFSSETSSEVGRPGNLCIESVVNNSTRASASSRIPLPTVGVRKSVQSNEEDLCVKSMQNAENNQELNASSAYEDLCTAFENSHEANSEMKFTDQIPHKFNQAINFRSMPFTNDPTSNTYASESNLSFPSSTSKENRVVAPTTIAESSEEVSASGCRLITLEQVPRKYSRARSFRNEQSTMNEPATKTITISSNRSNIALSRAGITNSMPSNEGASKFYNNLKSPMVEPFALSTPRDYGTTAGASEEGNFSESASYTHSCASVDSAEKATEIEKETITDNNCITRIVEDEVSASQNAFETSPLLSETQKDLSDSRIKSVSDRCLTKSCSTPNENYIDSRRDDILFGSAAVAEKKTFKLGASSTEPQRASGITSFNSQVPRRNAKVSQFSKNKVSEYRQDLVAASKSVVESNKELCATSAHALSILNGIGEAYPPPLNDVVNDNDIADVRSSWETKFYESLQTPDANVLKAHIESCERREAASTSNRYDGGSKRGRLFDDVDGDYRSFSSDEQDEGSAQKSETASKSENARADHVDSSFVFKTNTKSSKRREAAVNRFADGARRGRLFDGVDGNCRGFTYDKQDEDSSHKSETASKSENVQAHHKNSAFEEHNSSEHEIFGIHSRKELDGIAREFERFAASRSMNERKDASSAKKMSSTIRRLSVVLSSSADARLSKSQAMKKRLDEDAALLNAMIMALIIVRGCDKRSNENRFVILALKLLDKLTCTHRSIRLFVEISMSFGVLVGCAQYARDMLEVLDPCVQLLRKVGENVSNRNDMSKDRESVRILAKLTRGMAVSDARLAKIDERLSRADTVVHELERRGIKLRGSVPNPKPDSSKNYELRLCWKSIIAFNNLFHVVR